MSNQKFSHKVIENKWKKQNPERFDVLVVDTVDSKILNLISPDLPDLATFATINFDKIKQLAGSEYPPSLIVINVENAKVDPFNLLRRLKQAPETESIPLIMISDHENIDDRIRAFGIGCEEFISLPMRGDELAARLKSKIKLQEKQKQIKQLAYSDELSGIMNRRGYNEALIAEWARCRRSRTSLCMMLIDIDNFKQFNDTYGHKKGDELIQLTAASLKGVCGRSTDFVARYGGDEFVILLPQADYDDSAKLAQLILDDFKVRANNEIGVIPAPKVAISIGISCMVPNQSCTPVDLFNLADKALYQAKGLGKNGWQRA